MGWIKVSRIWETGGERLCHKIGREKIGLGSSEDQEETKGRRDITMNTNRAVMQGHVLQRDTLPILCPSPWGTLDTKLSISVPLPGLFPWLCLLLKTSQHHNQKVLYCLSLGFSCSLPCHRAAPPDRPASAFCSSPGSRFDVNSCQKRKYRRESWPCGRVVTAEKMKSNQASSPHGAQPQTPAPWHGGFLRVLQSTEAVCLQEMIIKVWLPCQEQKDPGKAKLYNAACSLRRHANRVRRDALTFLQ